jgi:hypothetical protein
VVATTVSPVTPGTIRDPTSLLVGLDGEVNELALGPHPGGQVLQGRALVFAPHAEVEDDVDPETECLEREP